MALPVFERIIQQKSNCMSVITFRTVYGNPEKKDNNVPLQINSHYHLDDSHRWY